MEYVLLFCGEERSGDPSGDDGAIYEKIGAWFGDLAASGRLRDARELQATSTATTVRLRGGDALVVDGPFIESKEVIGGYAVVDVANLDEALALAKSWPSPDSTIEVRPIVKHDG